MTSRGMFTAGITETSSLPIPDVCKRQRYGEKPQSLHDRLISKKQDPTLSVGSRIMFAGGIYGKVVGFENDETVNVEIAKGTVITISRYAIQSIEK